MRRRDEILADSEFNNWINFNLSIGLNDKLKLTPSLIEVSNHYSRHIKKVMQSVADFKQPLILSNCFEFLRKNIKNIMVSLQDRNQPPMFTFLDYLQNCE